MPVVCEKLFLLYTDIRTGCSAYVSSLPEEVVLRQEVVIREVVLQEVVLREAVRPILSTRIEN